MGETGEGVTDEERACPAERVEHGLRHVRNLVLSTIIATTSVACTAARLPTLDVAQERSTLDGVKGTLVYYEDDRLCLLPVDGAPARRVKPEKKPAFVGGIDAEGRIVYAHADMGGSLYDLFFDRYAPGYFRYELRVVSPSGAESILTKGCGFVHGLTVSTDGRVAVSVVDDPLEEGGKNTWSIKIIDLDTRQQRVLPMTYQASVCDLNWSRDERTILCTISDPPVVRDIAPHDLRDQSARITPPTRICQVDSNTGDVRTIAVGSHPLPVLDSDGIALSDKGSYRVIDERSGNNTRPLRGMPGADLPYNSDYLIAAPGPDRVIYRGLPPPWTNQLAYKPEGSGTLSLERMWSVHMADLSKGTVATILWQTHAGDVAFSRVDLAQALPLAR